MKNLITLVLIFCFSASTAVTAQSKRSQKETFQATYNEMKTLVQSKNYKYVGEVVYKDSERLRLDSASNTFSINNDSSVGTLSSLNSEAKALVIDGGISNYKVNFNDDTQNISIQFNVNKMTIFIDIKANGNAFIVVEGTVNNITQTGKLESI